MKLFLRLHLTYAGILPSFLGKAVSVWRSVGPPLTCGIKCTKAAYSMLFTCPQMFCVWLTLIFHPSLLNTGSAADVKYEQLCYGRSFRLPFDYTPPAFLGKLYFSPSNGGSSKLVMDKGEVSNIWGYNLSAKSLWHPFMAMRLNRIYLFDCPGWMCLCCPPFQTKDPRLQVFKDSVNFTMTERDGGTFSVSFGDNRPYNVITLKIWGEKITFGYILHI